ncbi:outer membrane protein TOM13-domain-containing protein [Radiomyces spectabilis]|uniref:outer membrane protein TOM13-domain-containing protein n=1 Tax=Radiomyces spectabilis TaxID=64574 RepID=UPI00221E5ECB|nr:outer membrane protein TOM13-domain-containing protein [Radiomyces spectabilis]KAI8370544.1 outer membrane protein TOM13-domain-containing protein [Radiomyces spectabilis]
MEVTASTLETSIQQNDTIVRETQETDVIVVKREPWYKQPTFLWILKSTAINFILPFFNGVMLGFGEILANELVFKYGWFGFGRISAATSVGLREGVPLTATAEYRKSLQAGLKHQQLTAEGNSVAKNTTELSQQPLTGEQDRIANKIHA